MSTVLLFGGTGFLGSNIAKRLLTHTNHRVVIAARNPTLFKFQNADTNNLMHEYCDISSDDDIMTLFERYQPSYCVNAVSAWKETASASFEEIHYYPVKRIVNECNKYNCSLAYLSGLGCAADPDAAQKYKSRFLKVRCHSERVLVEGHANKPKTSQRATLIFRPGGIVSDEYPPRGMLKPLIPLLHQLPAFAPMPLFGNGKNKMSLISVNDLSQIVVDRLLSDSTKCQVIELGNPQNEVSYAELVNIVNKAIHGQPKLTLSVWLWIWSNIAKVVETVGTPLDEWVPLQRAQVELMKHDLIAEPCEELKDFAYEDCFDLIGSAAQKYKKQHDW
mmetsp:Transcript_12333/g.19647  ORF Transcript_12333/g.19647 Transcript_12333/m.19647 type:complete len:333 (-) Transcript_12333:42-1040(-)